MVGGHVAPFTLDARYARSRELTVTWAFCYGRRDGEKEFQIALNLMGAGKLDYTPLITHRFSRSKRLKMHLPWPIDGRCTVQ